MHGIKRDAGFTLLEVMAAMAIFLLGILAIMALQSTSIRGNVRARGVTDISVLAADRLEKLIALPFDDPGLVAGNFPQAQATDGLDNNYDGEIDEDGEVGTLWVEWNIVNDWPIRNVKTITVTVNNNHPNVQRGVTVQNTKPEIL
jgi:prepilin-type N-terminal cleavage/methylation domain-containing protein